MKKINATGERIGQENVQQRRGRQDQTQTKSVRPQPVTHLLDPKSPSTHVLPDMVEDERGMPNMNKIKNKTR